MNILKHMLLLIVFSSASPTALAQNYSPYCPIPVYNVPNHPLGGQATYAPNGQPVILVDPALPHKIPGPFGEPFMRFLLAHECAHHMRGHLNNLAQAGMFGGYYLMNMSHSVEFDADCVATRMLRQSDPYAIDAAIWVFSNSNPFPTYSHPGGLNRAQNIQSCLHM